MKWQISNTRCILSIISFLFLYLQSLHVNVDLSPQSKTWKNTLGFFQSIELINNKTYLKIKTFQRNAGNCSMKLVFKSENFLGILSISAFLGDTGQYKCLKVMLI